MKNKDRLSKLEQKQRTIDDPLIIIMGCAPLPFDPTPNDIAQWIADGRAVSQYGGKVIIYDSRPEPTAEEWEATYGVTQ